MYNKVMFVGNMTRDIELRYLPNGGAIAKGAIASSYKYKTQDGQQKEEVCFLDFNIFGKGGEVFNQYTKKGSKVMLEGRLILEQWTDNNNQKQSKHSLRVDNFVFLDSKPQSQQQNQQPPQGQYNQPQNGQYNNYQG